MTDRVLARRTANAILDAFTAYHREFRKVTRQAKARFEQQDWRGLRVDAEIRLELYRNFVNRTVSVVKRDLHGYDESKALWPAVKDEYTQLITGHGDFNLAQSFYNSVTMRIIAVDGIDPDIQYDGSELPPEAAAQDGTIYATFYRRDTTQALIRDILHDYPFARGYTDLEESAALVAREIDSHLQQIGWDRPIETAEVARPVFYRGHLAFLVGRICSQGRYVPMILALSNSGEGIVVDAVLLTEDEVSIIFSFARWYFHVEVARPYALVGFLKSILPLKPVAELYISLGYNKHGKTELYRDLMRHLQHSTDTFEVARGTPGMVMVVFTLPSYHLVFKIIKDSFDYPKTTTRQEVRNRYYLVFKHDRGGRLVDAQEFRHLRFDKSRFSPALLDDLLRRAAHTVSVEDGQVVVKHLYVERRLIPLDLHVREAEEEKAVEAVVDFGQAVKDLAATNIFPGDILLKNFGVTRHGRVVFYDYDELCLLTDCNFRRIPEATTADEELSAEPWFSVNDRDVFPEELRHFVGLPPEMKEVFTRAHGELFDAEFWTELQTRYKAGEVIDVLPYKEQRRLPQTVSSD